MDVFRYKLMIIAHEASSAGSQGVTRKVKQHVALTLANGGKDRNLGDVLLHHALRATLQTLGILVLPRDRGLFSDRLYGHIALIMSGLRRRLGRDICATLVLPSGQGIGKTALAAPLVIARLGYLAFLRASGVRIVSIGRGCSLQSRVTQLQEHGLCRLLDFYSLRDRASIEAANAVGVCEVGWFPDLSWLESPCQPIQPPANRSSLVLCFREPQDHFVRDINQVLMSVEAVLREAMELGLNEFVLVAHSVKDERMTAAIEERFRQFYPLQREPGILSLAAIPRVYGKAALVVSNRLHSLLLGLQWGAQVLALTTGTETKIRGHLRDIGLDDQVLVVNEHGYGINPRPLRRVMAQQSTTKDAVAMYRKRASHVALTTLARLFPKNGTIDHALSRDLIQEGRYHRFNLEFVTNAFQPHTGKGAPQVNVARELGKRGCDRLWITFGDEQTDPVR
jgi:Polysaccharide pyruvyl transferase